MEIQGVGEEWRRIAKCLRSEGGGGSRGTSSCHGVLFVKEDREKRN